VVPMAGNIRERRAGVYGWVGWRMVRRVRGFSMAGVTSHGLRIAWVRAAVPKS